jgi:hypothetical protein
MRRFVEICMRIKIVAVEIAGVLVFIGFVGGIVFWEWSHIARFLTQSTIRVLEVCAIG